MFSQQILEMLRAKREQWQPGAGKSWSGRIGEVSVQVVVRDFDKFGYLLDEVEVQADAPITSDDCKAFVARVTYLTERLRLVEWDDGRGGVLRSEPSELDPDALAYFEFALRVGSAKLQRFTCGAPRQRVEFHLTERQFGRLLDDMVMMSAGQRTPSRLHPVVTSA